MVPLYERSGHAELCFAFMYCGTIPSILCANTVKGGAGALVAAQLLQKQEEMRLGLPAVDAKELRERRRAGEGSDLLGTSNPGVAQRQEKDKTAILVSNRLLVGAAICIQVAPARICGSAVPKLDRVASLYQPAEQCFIAD